jgi:hypothetical protein
MTSSHKYHARRLRLPLLMLLALLPFSPDAGAAPPPFDHAKFDALLSSAVSGGRVDYGKFRGNTNFAAYLASLESASVASLSTDEQLAFWMNAYNALVIRNVLDNPGMRRPTDVKGFFDGRKFRVAGKSLTLNDIENSMIRAKFNEPLIHFGLVCAARSCPPLGNRAFTGRTVRAQLARNAAAYLASPYNRFDASRNRLEMSKIFEWYKGDFGGDAGIREFVKKYGTAQMKSGVSSSTAVGFMEYDWTLNAR